MHKVGLPLWSTTSDGGVEPVEFVDWVPTAYVRKVEGVDYDSVPTHQLPSDAPETGSVRSPV